MVLVPVHDHYFRVPQGSVLAKRVVYVAIMYGNVLQVSEHKQWGIAWRYVNIMASNSTTASIQT